MASLDNPTNPLQEINMKLQPLIKKLNLDYVDSDITDANFPYEDKSNGELKLFNFNKNISANEVIAEMEEAGFRPATIHELITWKWGGGMAVVALGSVWQSPDGGRIVAYLDRSGVVGVLNLGWVGNDWLGPCRFLGVSKFSDTRALGSQSLDTLTLEEIRKLKKLASLMQ